MSPRGLLGSFEHTVDDKNRVIVPAAFRPILGNEFRITPSLSSQERHLRLYSEEKYEELIDQLEGFDAASAHGIRTNDFEGQRLLRGFYLLTVNAETDAQGRIVVPERLREWAGIGKRLVFIGRRSYVEVWDADVLQSHQSTSQPTPEDGTAARSLADYIS